MNVTVDYNKIRIDNEVVGVEARIRQGFKYFVLTDEYNKNTVDGISPELRATAAGIARMMETGEGDPEKVYLAYVMDNQIKQLNKTVDNYKQ